MTDSKNVTPNDAPRYSGCTTCLYLLEVMPLTPDPSELQYPSMMYSVLRGCVYICAKGLALKKAKCHGFGLGPRTHVDSSTGVVYLITPGVVGKYAPVSDARPYVTATITAARMRGAHWASLVDMKEWGAISYTQRGYLQSPHKI